MTMMLNTVTRFAAVSRLTNTFCRVLTQRSMCTPASDEVLLETVNNKGLITLNRSKALNALNLPMIRSILPQLKEWEDSSRISMVVIKGAGDKAFCAGGDIRAMLPNTPEAEDIRVNFFKEEYQLNNAIGTLEVPYVALIDGITMGGGVGLSVHGTFRVATEKTVFAMPETGIGLFPDVGGSYFLSRLGGKLGVYLALTGFRLKGVDVKRSGVATHYVTSDKIPALEKELLDLESPTDANTIGRLLDRYHNESNVSGQFALAPHMEKIDSIFSADTAEGILQKLKDDGSEWAQLQYQTLSKMSPTSVKVTLRQIQEGGDKTLQDCLEMEYRLSQRFMEDNDFFEGVRAVLVDRDNKPVWKPGTLSDVTTSMVDRYFSALPAEKELQL